MYHKGEKLIEISLNAEYDGYLVAAGHELTHYIKENNLSDYKELENFVVDKLSESYNMDNLIARRIALYKEYDVKITREQAIEEIVADSCFDVLSNEKFINELAKENKSLLKRIADWFKSFFSEIKKIISRLTTEEAKALRDDVEALDKINELFHTALENAKENTAIKSDGEVKYSLNKDFSNEYDKWDKKTKGFPFNIGTTSKVLQDIGIDNKKIYWDSSKILKIKKEHPAMSDAVIKQVPNILEEPILVMKSKTVDGRVTLFGEVYDNNNLPVLAVLELTPTDNKGNALNIIKVASAYGKDTNPQGLINKSEILYINPNKNKTHNWLSINRLQLPLHITNYGFLNTIKPQKIESVNSSISKNGGESDSNEKNKPSFDSEIVISRTLKDGTQLIKYNKKISSILSELFQGNRYYDFDNPKRNFYDIEKWKQDLKKYQVGTANETNFYTATLANFTETKKPDRKPDFVSNSSSMYWYTKDGVVRGSDHWNDSVATCSWFLEGNVSDKETYGFCKWEDFYHKPRPIYQHSNDDILLSNFNNVENGHLIYEDSVYSTKSLFSFTQHMSIKDIDESDSNEKSYSLKDSQGKVLTKEQAEFFKDSKVRDEDGNLLVVYHGSPNDFTVFDEYKYGENTGGRGFYGRGFYFATSKTTASNYGGNVTQVYLNAKKLLDVDKNGWTYLLGIEERPKKIEVDEVFVEEMKKGFFTVHYNIKDEPDNWRAFNSVSTMQLEDDKSGKSFVQHRLNPSSSILPRDIYNLAEIAREKGYDGIIGSATNIGDTGKEIVVFSPNQIKSVDNLNPTSDDDIRYSLKHTFANEMRKAIEQKNDYQESHIEVGNIPSFYSRFGFDISKPMTITAKHIRDITTPKNVNHSEYHGLAQSQVLDAIKSLNQPVTVLSSHKEDGTVVIVTNVIDNDNIPISIYIHPNGTANIHGLYMKSNHIKSVYGRENIVNYIKTADRDKRILFYDKKRSQDLRLNPGVYFPDIVENLDFNNNVSRYREIVNNYYMQNDKNHSLKHDDIRFSLKKPIEENNKLMAVHNLREDDLIKSIELGGFAMPSIALIKAGTSHESFGDITVVFDKSTIDPADSRNLLFSGDAWTPTFPTINYKVNEDKAIEIDRKIESILEKTGSAKAFGYLGLDDGNMTDKANSFAGDVSAGYKDKAFMQYAYLLDKGIDFEPPMRETTLVPTYDNESVIAIAKELGEERTKKLLDMSKDERATAYDEVATMMVDKLNETVVKKLKEQSVRNSTKKSLDIR